MEHEMTIAEVQKSALDMLDALDAHCGKHGITYCLAYGSLLGAVRHGGFIPWDDDADVWMMRTEFEKFIESFQTVGHIKLLRPCEKGYKTGWAKLIDTRTVYYNHQIVMPPDYGLSIDVFPLDDDRGELVDRIVRLHSKLRSFAVAEWRNSSRSALRILAKNALRLVPALYSYKSQLLVVGTRKSSQHVVNHFARYPYEIERMPREWFSEMKRVAFDGNHSFLIPADAKKILANIYGPNWSTPLRSERHAQVFWR